MKNTKLMLPIFLIQLFVTQVCFTQEVVLATKVAEINVGKSKTTFLDENILPLIDEINKISSYVQTKDIPDGAKVSAIATQTQQSKQDFTKNILRFSNKEFLDKYSNLHKMLYNAQLILYNRAIHDAKTAEPQEISDKLTPIVPWNKELIWNNKKSRVLMVSWMFKRAMEKFYKPRLGKDYTTSPNPEYLSWVTSVPQIKKFISGFIEKNKKNGLFLYNRLNQLLGLPPAKQPIQDKYFVEMWVKPADLLRPCVDNEILDTSCIVDPNPETMPESYKNIFQFVSPVSLTKKKSSYKEWFINERKQKYTGKFPFPWTRLGYTYDWGVENNNNLGLSEFIIKPDSTVIIHRIYSTETYYK